MRRVLLSIAGLMYLSSFDSSVAGAQSVDSAAVRVKAGSTADIPMSSQDELQQDILKVPCENNARLAAVKELFLRMGATESDITVAQLKNVENVVVTVKGRSDEYVVVGAHYDKSKAGCGAVDNWSGIVILAHLYRTIRAAEPLKTFLFVAFGREEGLVGSRSMVDAIAKEDRKRYCSMLNPDTFAFAAPHNREPLYTQADFLYCFRREGEQDSIRDRDICGRGGFEFVQRQRHSRRQPSWAVE